MAKKVVASLQKSGAKDFVKVIRSVKSKKTGAYTFKETIVAHSKVKDFLAENKDGKN